MMNIKAAWFYAALAGCVGAGYGGGVVVTQRDIDQARTEFVRANQCGEESATNTRNFKAPKTMNSPGMGF